MKNKHKLIRAALEAAKTTLKITYMSHSKYELRTRTKVINFQAEIQSIRIVPVTPKFCFIVIMSFFSSFCNQNCQISTNKIQKLSNSICFYRHLQFIKMFLTFKIVK